MLALLVYSLVRFLLDVIATSHSDQGKLAAEVLALRRQVQVLKRQIRRVRWTAGDRLIVAALGDHLGRFAIRYSEVPVVFAGSRMFAEGWAYRFLGAGVADRIEST